ncbi:hypothetical protein GCM10009846_25280 [Agrococcus versicolor]|uniref:Uncharacterized protein n=1 Tax=Agrococcus versicolor TaxID=501482 RepID=A0ABN3AWF9_9MICO
MDEAPHARAWRIAAPALLGWNVLGGVVGGALLVAVVELTPGAAASVVVVDSVPLAILVVGVAAMLGAVGGLMGGGTLVLARGRRPSRRTLVRGVAAGLVVCAIVAAAGLGVPILPDGARPLAVAIGLAIGALMLGLAFRAHEVHWREGDHAVPEPSVSRREGGPGPGPAASDPARDPADDPIRAFVHPDRD